MIRETRETRVEVSWVRSGGDLKVATGLGFLDHMLEQWAFHGGFGLRLRAEGDLRVDAHHTVEDVALSLGEALCEDLGGRSGIRRFGCAYAPMEDALARAVVDLVRRPFCAFRCPPLPPTLGDMPSELIPHFFRSLASAGRFTLHLDVLCAENGHHAAEASFKALGLAFAGALLPGCAGPASSKGVL